MLELLEPPWQAARSRRQANQLLRPHRDLGCFAGGQLRHSRGLSAGVARGQPRGPYHILWVRGFRAHTISRPQFNHFKPLRRHFRATPSCRQPLAPRSQRPKRLGSKDRRSARRSPPGHTGTNIERLRNSSKKFVERLGNYAPLVELLACDRGAAGRAHAEAENAALMFERRLSSPPPRSRQGVRSRSGPRENRSPPPPPG